jgi:plasmid stabilization system protein ParE
MTFRVHFSVRAKPEIQDAYNWYEEQQTGLGEEFLLKLDERLDLISSHSFSFPQKRGSFRECYLGDFPFIIMYEIKEERINILAVIHTSRNPKVKRIR